MTLCVIGHSLSIAEFRRFAHHSLVPILYPVPFTGTHLGYLPGLLVILPARSDSSPYEKRVDARGHVLSDKSIADEVPFEKLPVGWAWARLETALVNRDSERIPVSVADRERLAKIYDYYGASGVIDKVDRYLFDKTLLLIGEDGANLLIRSKPIAFLARGKYWVNNHAHVLDGISERYLEYIALFINSISLAPYVTGTAQPKMNQAKMGLIIIPIPPENEQARILAKINELMPLVEEYGRLEDAREELDADLPGRLRKSVLQMAVQGKLVPQDPADEPASELLERIREQRRQLVAEKKMKAPKGGESVVFRGSDGRRYEKRIDAKGRESEPACIEGEIPFEIPDSWEWARLESLISLLSGTDLKPGQYNDQHEGIPYLTGASNFSDGALVENRWTSEATRVSRKGELLFTCKGTVGEMAVNSFEKAHIARQIMAIAPSDEDSLPYLTIYLKSMVESIRSSAKGVIPGIERNTLLNALIPVPPTPEQARISKIIASLSKVIS